MTERVPNSDEVVVVSGIFTQKIRRLLTYLLDGINGTRPIIIEPAEYANLAELNDTFPNPTNRMMVLVTGQGLATYNGTNWVLCSNDTTLVI